VPQLHSYSFEQLLPAQRLLDSVVSAVAVAGVGASVVVAADVPLLQQHFAVLALPGVAEEVLKDPALCVAQQMEG